MQTFRDKSDDVVRRALNARFTSMVRIRRLSYSKQRHEAMLTQPEVPVASKKKRGSISGPSVTPPPPPSGSPKMPRKGSFESSNAPKPTRRHSSDALPTPPSVAPPPLPNTKVETVLEEDESQNERTTPPLLPRPSSVTATLGRRAAPISRSFEDVSEAPDDEPDMRRSSEPPRPPAAPGTIAREDALLYAQLAARTKKPEEDTEALERERLMEAARERLRQNELEKRYAAAEPTRPKPAATDAGHQKAVQTEAETAEEESGSSSDDSSDDEAVAAKKKPSPPPVKKAAPAPSPPSVPAPPVKKASSAPVVVAPPPPPAPVPAPKPAAKKETRFADAENSSRSPSPPAKDLSVRVPERSGSFEGRTESVMIVDIENAMDAERLSLIKTAFILCDDEGSGSIHMNDVEIICKHVGMEKPLTEQEFDAAGIYDERINMRQYLVVMGHKSEVDLYEKVFKMVDIKQRGFIDEQDLTEIMEMMSISDPEGEARKVIQNTADKARNIRGIRKPITLDFDEFVDAMIRLG